MFPSQLSPGKPISENTLNGALRRMDIQKSEHTSHGFRASASSLLYESGLWSRDAIKAKLAHVGSDLVRRAQHRAAYWDVRERMAGWAEPRYLGMSMGGGERDQNVPSNPEAVSHLAPRRAAQARGLLAQ